MVDNGCVKIWDKNLDGYGGVAVLEISHAPVNALSPQTLLSLSNCMETVQKDPRVCAIVITGSKSLVSDVSCFSAGFDITSLRSQQIAGKANSAVLNVNEVLNSLVEAGPKPVVAAINGLALGGGCEVAMACAARVAVPHAKLGLPELQLGIIPGFGGTQRLPRLVGVETALKAMLTSKSMSAIEGKLAGLVDEIVPEDALILESARVALEIATDRRKRRYSLLVTDKLPKRVDEAVYMMKYAKQQSRKRQPNLKHPLLCIDAILAGITDGSMRGLEKEKEVFQQLLFSESSKALVHIFLAQRGAGKLQHAPSARKIELVAIIGGGLMGSGIATSLVLAGVNVLLKEINETAMKAGIQRVRANLESSAKKGKLSKEKLVAALAKLQGTLTYEDFPKVDMVIEAVIESIPLKQKIFVDLEAVCRPDCILTTNTSTINIELVAEKLNANTRKRICGAHFFSPAHIMPLLEVVRTRDTNIQVLTDTIALGKRMKKTPVVVGNCTGFAVNRVFFPYTMAACLLVDAGIDPYTIDKIIKSWGMPMGPFRLTDLVGGDIGMHVAESYIRDFSDRVYQSNLIPIMNDAKRLGEKTGRGFYHFKSRGQAFEDTKSILPLLNKSRSLANFSPSTLKRVASMSEDEILEVIMFPVVNEACRVLQEGIVSTAADLDVCAVLGMGFPAYRYDKKFTNFVSSIIVVFTLLVIQWNKKILFSLKMGS